MSERRLTEALRRLHDRAAAAALAEEPRSIGHENFRAFARRVIAEEIRNSGAAPDDDLRIRLAEVERKLDEFMQIIGSFDNDPPPPPPVASAEPFYQPSPATSYADSYAAPNRYPGRRRRPRLPVLIVVGAAVLLAALGLMLAVAGLLPASVTTFFDSMVRPLAAGLRDL
jgi:hypothetical protein